MKHPSSQYKRVRRLMQKAIIGYNMIEPGDRVAVGVSGGHDSFVLLNILTDFRTNIFHDFNILAVHIDLGFQKESPYIAKILEFCKNLGVEITVINTEISKISMAPDAKKNPCFICSINRRKEIYKFAHKNECNKIAYGHHQDDIIETLLINILFGRKIETMNPVQPVFSGTMEIIRPFSLVPEYLIKSVAREIKAPVISKLCPVDEETRRQKIKDILKELQRTEHNANIRKNIFRSLINVSIDFPIPDKNRL